MRVPTFTQKTTRRIGDIFGLIAGLGAVVVLAEADVGRWDATSIYASVVMIIGAVPFVIVQASLRRRTPQTERRISDQLRFGGAPITLGLGSWIIGLLMCIGFETLVFQLKYGALFLALFCAIALVTYLETRSKFGTEANFTLLLSIASSLAVPFSVLGLRNPDLLATAFPMQFDTLLSLRISLLLFAANQVFLGAAIVLIAGNVWRNRLLTRNKITRFDFQRLNDEMAKVIARVPELGGLEGPLRDTSTVVDLFQRAESKAVFGWGWSIIDRLLHRFGVSRRRVGDALGLTDRIREVQKIRDKTVHGGYVPTLPDSVLLLVLIRDIIREFSQITVEWLRNLKVVNVEKASP